VLVGEPCAGPGPADAPTAEELARRITETRVERQRGLLYWFLWAVAPITTFWSLSEMWVPGGWVLLVVAAVLWAVAHGMHRLAERAESAATALMLSDLGPEALGPVIELLSWPHRRVRSVARWQLIAMLPRLTPDDARHLTSVQRACLYDTLTPLSAQTSPELVEATLAALPSIADERALPAVMRLVRMPGWTRRLRRIRMTARALLTRIEARILEQRTPGDAGAKHRGAASEDAEAGELRAGFGDELGFRPQMRFAFLVAMWLTAVPFGVVSGIRSLTSGAWLDAAGYFLLAALSTQLYRVTMFSKHARLARQLLTEQDVSAIGRLAEAACWPDARVRAAALSSLTRLLPKLKASDAGVLTTAQRGCLHALLNGPTARAHPEVVVALLRALEQVGDLAAVPFVRNLANLSDSSARTVAVRDAAGECLPVLMERARLNTDPQILLRPAEAPGPPEETLLRPVYPGILADTATLVRPIETEDAATADGSA